MKPKKQRPGTGNEMRVLYSRKTKHDSRPRKQRTRQNAKRAAIKEYS